MNKSIATIKEIAKRANVSIGTVDRVLHNRGNVSKATEEKIKRIIEELDYRPNIFAKNLRMSKTFTFGVLTPEPSQDSMYWSLPLNGIAKAQSELSSQRVAVKYFYYNKYSEGSCRRANQEAIASDLDGLLIAPVVSEVCRDLVRRIPDSVPYVYFDSFIPDTGYVSYIGQDSFQSGVLSGKLMDLVMRDPGSVAVIKMLPEDYHINARIEGFLDYCRRCRHLKTRVYEMRGNGDPGARDRLFHKMVSDNSDLKGVFVSNASTHLAAEFLKKRNQDHGIHVIGFDLIEANVKCLKEGTIDFLISQQSERQGYDALYTLYRYVVLNEPVERNVLMQLDIVTSENIDYYKS
jgi:LacI family transcriptional regulator